MVTSVHPVQHGLDSQRTGISSESRAVRRPLLMQPPPRMLLMRMSLVFFLSSLGWNTMAAVDLWPSLPALPIICTRAMIANVTTLELQQPT